MSYLRLSGCMASIFHVNLIGVFFSWLFMATFYFSISILHA